MNEPMGKPQLIFNMVILAMVGCALFGLPAMALRNEIDKRVKKHKEGRRYL